MTESHVVPEWITQQYGQSHSRFIAFYTQFAREHKHDHDALQSEIGNLLRALSWIMEGQPEAAVDMVNDLGTFFLQRGYWAEGLDVAEQVSPIAVKLTNVHPTEEKRMYTLASLQVMRVGFHLLQGNVEQAGATLHQLLEIENLMEHQMLSGSLVALIAALTEVRGENSASLDLYRTTLEHVETVDYLPLISYLLFVIADLLTQQGEYEEALALFWKKLELDRQTHDLSSMIDTLQGLAGVAERAGLPDVAEQCQREALKLAQGTSSAELQHDTLKALGTKAYEREDYAEAARLYEQAVLQARRTGNKWMVASTLTFLALAREELGEDVLGLLQESLSISQDINDYGGMAMAMIQLGDAYLTEQDVERAREQYSQAAEIATGINNHPLVALAYLNLGELALEQEQWGEAEEYYEQGLEAHLRFDDPSSRAMVLRGLGLALFMQGKMDRAKDVIQRNAVLYGELEDWENHAQCLYALAGILVQENRIGEAEPLARRSLDILKKIGSQEAATVEAALARLSETGKSRKRS